MSKTVIRVTPVAGFDIPELERWLAAMSKKGLRFSMTAGLLTVFERAERRTVQDPFGAYSGSGRRRPRVECPLR